MIDKYSDRPANRNRIPRTPIVFCKLNVCSSFVELIRSFIAFHISISQKSNCKDSRKQGCGPLCSARTPVFGLLLFRDLLNIDNGKVLYPEPIHGNQKAL